MFGNRDRENSRSVVDSLSGSIVNHDPFHGGDVELYSNFCVVYCLESRPSSFGLSESTKLRNRKSRLQISK